MRKGIRYLLVLLAAVLLFGRLGSVLEPNYDGNLAFQGFYRLERDTADVVFYGSSHVYAGINVIDLWDHYGISAYNMAGTMQTLWNSYYNMQETLKYQTPRVMVVDLYGALIEEEYYTPTNVIKNADSMRFSVNKIRNIWSSVPHDQFLSYILSYPLRHDHYESLEKANYIDGAGDIGGKWYKGFQPVFGVTEYGALPAVAEPVQPREPFWKNREYLNKMVALAKENHIQLLFTVVPYESWQAEDEAVYRWIEAFAEENGVSFINGNQHLDKMGFDAKTDYAEASHLNYSGACKFTEYIGEILQDGFALEDHRGEKRCQSWQNYSDCWAAYQKDLALTEIDGAEDYMEALRAAQENYIVFVSLDNHYRQNPYTAALRTLSENVPEDFENNGTYVIDGGNLLYRTPDEPEYLWCRETDSLDIAIVRTYGGEMQLLVNNTQQNNHFSDVSITVYDKINDRLADSVTYNSDGGLVR